jgi:hypothetical protein
VDIAFIQKLLGNTIYSFLLFVDHQLQLIIRPPATFRTGIYNQVFTAAPCKTETNSHRPPPVIAGITATACMVVVTAGITATAGVVVVTFQAGTKVTNKGLFMGPFVAVGGNVDCV